MSSIRFPSDRIRRLPPRTADLLLALALTVALWVELTLLGDSITGPWEANWLLGSVMTLALAFRRRARTRMVTVMLAAIVVSNALDGSLMEDPFTPFFAMFLAMYSVGGHPEFRLALRGLAIAVVGIELAVALSLSPETGDYIFTIIVVLGFPWTAGRVARIWADRARALEEMNVRLESEQMSRERLAVSDERTRIARELHDVVAHSISVMVVQAEGAKRMLERDPKRATVALEQIEATGRSALTEMRRLLGVLRKDDEQARLTPQPGMAALDNLITRARGTGLDVDVSISGQVQLLAPGIDVSAYRIVQEALTNSLRHAGKGTHADVRIDYGLDCLEIEVLDDGPGPGSEPKDWLGQGLVGMRERVALYGGTFNVGANPDGGFRLYARLPLETL